jgi:hypothetical protein
LTNAQKDIEDAFLSVISQSQTEVVSTQKVDVKKEKKEKKMSGYNLFMREKMKNEKLPMKEAVGLCKQMIQEEKEMWNEKVKVKNGEVKKVEVVDQKKEKKEKKWSGYTLFMSKKMKEDKLPMKEAVGLWKQMTQDEKNLWNEKVKEKNL